MYHVIWPLDSAFTLRSETLHITWEMFWVNGILSSTLGIGCAAGAKGLLFNLSQIWLAKGFYIKFLYIISKQSNLTPSPPPPHKWSRVKMFNVAVYGGHHPKSSPMGKGTVVKVCGATEPVPAAKPVLFPRPDSPSLPYWLPALLSSGGSDGMSWNMHS